MTNMEKMISRLVEGVKTGKLISVGMKNLGRDRYEYYKCVDCGTEYPVIDGRITCNGVPILLCPWCRPDSKPWTHGRGI